MPYYLNPHIQGLKQANNIGDGYGIHLRWARAFPNVTGNKVAYNIYIQTKRPDFEIDFFSNNPTLVSVDGSLEVDIFDLEPGQMYWFAVRAIEYDSSIVDLVNLPQTFNGLRIYPESLLASNITETSSLIPLVDTELFPNIGIIKIGTELIYYSNKNDSVNLLSGTIRGYLNSKITFHNTDGYDGYHMQSPYVIFWPGEEEQNTVVYSCQNRFEYDNYAFTIPDGYRQKTKDILTTDLSASDAFNEDFPTFPYSGWLRTDPQALFAGDCVGSYFGGEWGCADGYSGVGMQMRGMSVQDINNMRQEFLLENFTGEPFVLVKRRRTGITCACFIAENEVPDDRCPKCYGGGIVISWEQYFNPRRSDGRILVSVNPGTEDLKPYDAGMESERIIDAWTLTVPTIKDRDFLIRFDQDDNEEFRYEVLDVTRNRLLNRLNGNQHFKMQRVRKTDPIYQVRVFRNTALIPSTITTSVSSSLGIPPHTHEIVINENIVGVNQINQMTSVAAGHSHSIINGVVQESVGHIHIINL